MSWWVLVPNLITVIGVWVVVYMQRKTRKLFDEAIIRAYDRGYCIGYDEASQPHD